MGRVPSPGGDTCTGQELNLNYAFLLQDCTCRIKEVDQASRRKRGRGNVIIKRHRSLCLVPSGERAGSPRKRCLEAEPLSQHTPNAALELSVRQMLRACYPQCVCLFMTPALCSLPGILKRTSCVKVDGPGPELMPVTLTPRTALPVYLPLPLSARACMGDIFESLDPC